MHFFLSEVPRSTEDVVSELSSWDVPPGACVPSNFDFFGGEACTFCVPLGPGACSQWCFDRVSKVCPQYSHFSGWKYLNHSITIMNKNLKNNCIPKLFEFS